MQKSFWWWECSDRYIFFPIPPPPLGTGRKEGRRYSFPPFSPSLISLTVSVDVKQHVYLLSTVHPPRSPWPEQILLPTGWGVPRASSVARSSSSAGALTSVHLPHSSVPWSRPARVVTADKLRFLKGWTSEYGLLGSQAQMCLFSCRMGWLGSLPVSLLSSGFGSSS